MWSVADAKAHLSEILRRARAGEPQAIGAHDPCVVVSAATYRTRISETGHDGRWLIEQAARVGEEIQAPSRHADRADTPFGE